MNQRSIRPWNEKTLINPNKDYCEFNHHNSGFVFLYDCDCDYTFHKNVMVQLSSSIYNLYNLDEKQRCFFPGQEINNELMLGAPTIMRQTIAACLFKVYLSGSELQIASWPNLMSRWATIILHTYESNTPTFSVSKLRTIECFRSTSKRFCSPFRPW